MTQVSSKLDVDWGLKLPLLLLEMEPWEFAISTQGHLSCFIWETLTSPGTSMTSGDCAARSSAALETFKTFELEPPFPPPSNP